MTKQSKYIFRLRNTRLLDIHIYKQQWLATGNETNKQNQLTQRIFFYAIHQPNYGETHEQDRKKKESTTPLNQSTAPDKLYTPSIYYRRRDGFVSWNLYGEMNIYIKIESRSRFNRKRGDTQNISATSTKVHRVNWRDKATESKIEKEYEQQQQQKRIQVDKINSSY